MSNIFEQHQKAIQKADSQIPKAIRDVLSPLRSLSAIARDIQGSAWYNSASSYGAKPYVQAMCELETLADFYGLEDGKTIVLYALSNMATFRGDVAKAVKAELKAHLKG
jgi:hypothetical protein